MNISGISLPEVPYVRVHKQLRAAAVLYGAGQVECDFASPESHVGYTPLRSTVNGRASRGYQQPLPVRQVAKYEGKVSRSSVSVYFEVQKDC
jgi:hypothetical protein